MLYSIYYLSKNKNADHNFINWINIIEKNVLDNFGFYLLDIPDENYMYYYESNYEPKEIVEIIQKSNNFVQVNKK